MFYRVLICLIALLPVVAHSEIVLLRCVWTEEALLESPQVPIYYTIDVPSRKITAENLGMTFSITRIDEYAIHAERKTVIGSSEKLTLDRRSLELVTTVVSETKVRTYMVNCGIAPEKVL